MQVATDIGQPKGACHSGLDGGGVGEEGGQRVAQQEYVLVT